MEPEPSQSQTPEPTVPAVMPPRPQSPKSNPSRLNTNSALLLGGSLLIIVAIFTIVTTGWSAYSSTMRVLITLLPLVVLYAISALTDKNEDLRSTSRYTLGTASTIFPFVLGTCIFELAHVGILSPTFFAEVCGLSALWFIILEFGFHKTDHTPLSVTFITLTTYFFLQSHNAPSYWYSLAAILLAILYLGIAYREEKTNQTGQTEVYFTTAIILGLIGLVTFPLAYLEILYSALESTDYYARLAALYIAMGISLFLVAVFYARLYQKTHYRHALQVRFIAESISPFLMVVPVGWIALFNLGDTMSALLLFVAGIICLVISNFTSIRAHRFAAFMGLGFGILFLIFDAYTQLGAYAPLLLLLGGFVLIGAAYYLNTHDFHKSLSTLTSYTSDPWLGLGKLPEGEATSQLLTIKSGRSLLLTLFVFILFSALIASINDSYTSNEPSYPLSYNYRDATPDPYYQDNSYPVSTPEPTPTVAPIESAPSSGWIAFSGNQDLGFTFLYNSAWLIPDDINNEIFTCQIDGYTTLDITSLNPTDTPAFSSFSSSTGQLPLNDPHYTSTSFTTTSGDPGRELISPTEKFAEVILGSKLVQIKLISTEPENSQDAARSAALNAIFDKVVKSVTATSN